MKDTNTQDNLYYVETQDNKIPVALVCEDDVTFCENNIAWLLLNVVDLDYDDFCSDLSDSSPDYEDAIFSAFHELPSYLSDHFHELCQSDVISSALGQVFAKVLTEKAEELETEYHARFNSTAEEIGLSKEEDEIAYTQHWHDWLDQCDELCYDLRNKFECP